jgi:hypothetical protein
VTPFNPAATWNGTIPFESYQSSKTKLGFLAHRSTQLAIPCPIEPYPEAELVVESLDLSERKTGIPKIVVV